MSISDKKVEITFLLKISNAFSKKYFPRSKIDYLICLNKNPKIPLIPLDCGEIMTG